MMISKTGTKDNSDQDNGYILLETMLAIACLSITVIFIMQGFITSIRGLRASQNRLKAAYLLEEKFWEIEDNLRHSNISLQSATLIVSHQNAGNENISLAKWVYPR